MRNWSLALGAAAFLGRPLGGRCKQSCGNETHPCSSLSISLPETCQPACWDPGLEVSSEFRNNSSCFVQCQGATYVRLTTAGLEAANGDYYAAPDTHPGTFPAYWTMTELAGVVYLRSCPYAGPSRQCWTIQLVDDPKGGTMRLVYYAFSDELVPPRDCWQHVEARGFPAPVVNLRAIKMLPASGICNEEHAAVSYLHGFQFFKSKTVCLVYFIPMWILSSTGKFWGAWIGSVGLAVVAEGLMAAHRRLWASKPIVCKASRVMSLAFLGNVCLFAAVRGVGYLLALLVLSYSFEMFIAVIMGLSIGYTAFSLREQDFEVPAHHDPPEAEEATARDAHFVRISVAAVETACGELPTESACDVARSVVGVDLVTPLKEATDTLVVSLHPCAPQEDTAGRLLEAFAAAGFSASLEWPLYGATDNSVVDSSV